MFGKLFKKTPKETPKRVRTALHDAAAAGRMDKIETLLREGADPNAVDGRGDTPLRLTAWRGPATLLLNAGADIHTTNDIGLTVTHRAAYMPNPLLLPFYLERGAKPDSASTDDGTTPLLIAARSGHDYQVLQLLLAGARANVRTKTAWSIGHVHAQVVQKILLFFAALDELQKVDELGATAEAARDGATALLRSALGKCAPPDELDSPALAGSNLHSANVFNMNVSHVALATGQLLWSASATLSSPDFDRQMRDYVSQLAAGGR